MSTESHSTASDAARMSVTVDELTLGDGERALHYRGHNMDGEIPSGNFYAAVMVRINEDNDHDIIYMEPNQSEPIQVLDRTIAQLTRARDQLAQMVPAEQRHGQCMEGGDWGRCKLSANHVEGMREAGWETPEHLFPTEEEWRAEYEVASVPMKRRSA